VPYDELLRLVNEARIIVTHAGAGSTLLALGQGKRPVLVPRRAEYGEAVDDHQVSFAERMADLGLAHVVNDPVNLAEFLRTMPGDDEHPSARTHSLAEALRVHLAELLGPPSGTS
jgi:UDP-N-acetylglucosamine transferase subunit ALG13